MGIKNDNYTRSTRDIHTIEEGRVHFQNSDAATFEAQRDGERLCIKASVDGRTVQLRLNKHEVAHLRELLG